eukprot:gnl/TRDRNA2_/TRDRNA2_160892_c0_seq1.p1 gnl/TRDRNA2_/TRDRNA2_160892_c0~~gnl/TRDRNA2_/TRDRNA2_160892_c0_seq1.p1  ORF type:complete len:599 (-),score=87.57 gnl/TRDRNA2_/TRDRNA2_160892_c0_seq1:107-1642(-)
MSPQAFPLLRPSMVYPKGLASTFSEAVEPCQSWDSSRVFGGIEAKPRPTIPSFLDVQNLENQSRIYQEQHRAKPRVIAFVNSRSGGQIGELLRKTLAENIGSESDANTAVTGEVCDLSRRDEPDRTLEQLAASLTPDSPLTRLLVCGGDGTVTWILTALEHCPGLEGKLDKLPVAIVPLGTGNDLARSLGWGKKLRQVGDIVRYLELIMQAVPVTMDQWRIVLRPHEQLSASHKLRTCGSHPQLVTDRDLSRQLHRDIDEALGLRSSDMDSNEEAPVEEVFLGLWQNYFSIGFDAKVAYQVDRARSTTACGQCAFRRGLGKLCYAWQGCHGSCSGVLTSRNGLQRFKVATAVRGKDEGLPLKELQDMDPPLSRQRVQSCCRTGRVRSLMFVNINSFGGGMNVQPKPDRVAVPPSPDDGTVEVMAMRNFAVMAGLFLGVVQPKYLVSSELAAFVLASGEFMQIDGEPWYLDAGCDVLIHKHRQVKMLCAPASAPFWRGHVSPNFWHPDAAET